jgi:Methyltransferase domain
LSPTSGNSQALTIHRNSISPLKNLCRTSTRRLQRKQKMGIIDKAVEAIRIVPQAAHALYFDVFRQDPDHIAQTARASIRDACFLTGADHKIRAVALAQWLSEFATPPSALTMAFAGNQNSDVGAVGSAGYFQALAAICAATKPEQIVEFGTYLGVGTATMALNCDAQILTIDLPDSAQADEIESLNVTDRNLVGCSRNRVGSSYRGKPYASRIKELRCDSRVLNLGEHIAQAQLCLVDGGHSYECVAADTKSAFRVIAPGGIIIWDDYFWLYPDVVKFLNEMAEAGTSLAKIKGTNLVVYRHQAVQPLR